MGGVPPATELQSGMVWLPGGDSEPLGALVEDLFGLRLGGRGFDAGRPHVCMSHPHGAVWSGARPRSQRGAQFSQARREFLGESKRLWIGERWLGSADSGETLPVEAGTRCVRCFGIER